jgi:hypothetical protein
MKQNRDEIIVVDRINTQTIEVEYLDGEKEQFDIILIQTRLEAIEKAITLTKKALLLPDAFDNLGRFVNDFSRHRNYEIEEYIDKLSNTVGHKIIELCPFNGFSTY